MADLVADEAARRQGVVTVLDPFAGTGKIHTLHQRRKIKTIGVELEPEWASQHEQTVCGNSLHLREIFGSRMKFDIIATSPCYGNRMADHHEARDDSKRMTYRHQLGRMPSDDSAAVLHWGPKYREFHVAAWQEATSVLIPGGLFILNVKNFMRTRTIKGKKVKEVVDVCQFHLDVLTDLGYDLEASIIVPTSGMGFGANSKKRINHEMVYALRKETR